MPDWPVRREAGARYGFVFQGIQDEGKVPVEQALENIQSELQNIVDQS